MAFFVLVRWLFWWLFKFLWLFFFIRSRLLREMTPYVHVHYETS